MSATIVLYLQELSNVPHFSNSKCYAQVILGHHKLITDQVELHSHKAVFAKKPIRLSYKDTDNMITIIYYVSNDGKSQKLGQIVVPIGNANNNRFLLQQSRTNSIAKISLNIEGGNLKGSEGSENGIVSSQSMNPVNSVKNRLFSKSTSIHSPGASSATSNSISKISNLNQSDSISKTFDNTIDRALKFNCSDLPLPTANTLSGDANTKKFDGNIQSQALNAIEPSILDALINRTYQFTWKSQYKEFTPSECIADIVLHNGNGWKKNDEGVDLVDVNLQEVKIGKGDTRRCQNKHGDSYYITLSDNESDEDEFVEFELPDIKVQNGSTESVNHSQFKEHENDHEHDHEQAKELQVKRVRPLDESEVREGLASWHISQSI
ncbi:hypothetical protein DAMA08_025200 [Martiniozyma asiatica (nom. inval.)]|nr:hypothetical protein DAMA08_025200 [Martiniozyma asiatica]